MPTRKMIAMYFTWILRPLSRKDGIAMVLVLLAIMSISLLGLFGSSGARTELNIARNDQLADQSLSLAEAGLNHAVASLQAALTAGTNMTAAAALATNGANAALSGFGTTKTFKGQTYLFKNLGGTGDDGYYVRMVDNFDEPAANALGADTDRTVRIIALGRTGTTLGVDGSGAMRQIEAMVGVTPQVDCAIVSRGDLQISGNPQVQGSQGCVHTNRSTLINGSPNFSTQPTSSSTMTITGGSAQLNGNPLTPAPNHPSAPIPSINVLNFNGTNLAQAVTEAGGYILHWNGQVTRGGTVTCTFSSPNFCTVAAPAISVMCGGACPNIDGAPFPWEFAGGTPTPKWQFSGNAAGPNRPFFVEGWVNINGSPGSATTPWRTTIVALNTIDVSGTPYIAPFNPLFQPAPTTTWAAMTPAAKALENMLFVSGNDIGLGGNAGVAGEPGIILAHQQIKYNGNPTINGMTIAEDAGRTMPGNVALGIPPLTPVTPAIPGDPAPLCTSDKEIECNSGGNQISGNPTLIYNGGLMDRVYPPVLTMIGWNEVRN